MCGCVWLCVFADMSGVIPLDEEDQETYDDIGAVEAEPIDDDIYEELPGLPFLTHRHTHCVLCQRM